MADSLEAMGHGLRIRCGEAEGGGPSPLMGAQVILAMQKMPDGREGGPPARHSVFDIRLDAWLASWSEDVLLI